MSSLLQLTSPDARLEDRYTLYRGTVILTGVQTAIRVVFDQMRRDAEAGLRTGALVSRYPGSPLARFDLELARERALTEALNVVHQPGLSEELAGAPPRRPAVQVVDDSVSNRGAFVGTADAGGRAANPTGDLRPRTHPPSYDIPEVRTTTPA